MGALSAHKESITLLELGAKKLLPQHTQYRHLANTECKCVVGQQ